MIRSVTTGTAVVFVDEHRTAHDALITNCHGIIQWDDEKPYGGKYGEPGFNWPPCLNLVYVLKDESRTDQYGQQLRHVSSVVHESQNTAGGYLWRLK